MFHVKTKSLLNSLGVVDNYHLEQVKELYKTYWLKWNYDGISSPWFCIFLDGKFVGKTLEHKYLLKLSDSWYDIKIVPLSECDAFNIYNSNFQIIPEKGNRLKLQWDEISLDYNPDFYSYLIYMDDAVVSENIGTNKNIYVTPELEDGVYHNFKIEYKDFLGNVSNENLTFSGCVQTIPKKPTFEMFYNSGNRQLTISGTKPSGQVSDIAEYWICNNHPYNTSVCLNNISVNNPKYVFYPDETISYTSNELYSGSWLWTVIAVDKNGFQSEYDLSGINIGLNGEVLYPYPPKPYSLKLDALSSGRIQSTVVLNETSGISGIYVNIDDKQKYHAYVSGTKEYKNIFSGFTNGLNYSGDSYTYNTQQYSEIIYSNVVKADDSAPSGNHNITLTMVR